MQAVKSEGDVWISCEQKRGWGWEGGGVRFVICLWVGGYGGGATRIPLFALYSVTSSIFILALFFFFSSPLLPKVDMRGTQTLCPFASTLLSLSLYIFIYTHIRTSLHLSSLLVHTHSNYFAHIRICKKLGGHKFNPYKYSIEFLLTLQVQQ